MVEVGESLSGMVDVALQVDQSGLLLQHSVLVALFESVRDLFLICVTFAYVHIVADAHYICHKADHVGCLAHRLAVGYLAFALVEILYLKSQQTARRGKGEACAGGVIAEVRDA